MWPTNSAWNRSPRSGSSPLQTRPSVLAHSEFPAWSVMATTPEVCPLAVELIVPFQMPGVVGLNDPVLVDPAGGGFVLAPIGATDWPALLPPPQPAITRTARSARNCGPGARAYKLECRLMAIGGSSEQIMNVAARRM